MPTAMHDSPPVSSSKPKRGRRFWPALLCLLLLLIVAVGLQRKAYHADPPGLRSVQVNGAATLFPIQDQEDLPPLLLAARAGDTRKVRQLLTQGADVHQKSLRAHTALLLAVENGREEIIQMLLAQGADEHDLTGPKRRTRVPATDTGLKRATQFPALREAANPGDPTNAPLPPLVLAAKYGSPALLRFLLERHDASLNPQTADSAGCTPLHYAVGLSNPEISRLLTELLLAHGADVNTRDNKGRIALMPCRSSQVAALLIAHGADINARDDAGHTVLMLNLAPRIAEMLLARGADINARDSHGNTPLLAAIRSTQTESVAFLLKHGANVAAVNDQGETPLFAAQATRFEPMVILLLNAGARR